MRPEGPPVNRPGRQAGIRLLVTMSAEGEALYDAISFECRAFSAHSIEIANPGLAAEAIH